VDKGGGKQLLGHGPLEHARRARRIAASVFALDKAHRKAR
jgi:hypothetical protein